MKIKTKLSQYLLLKEEDDVPCVFHFDFPMHSIKHNIFWKFTHLW